jgi:phage-related protein
MSLTLSSDANDGRFTVNLGTSGATLTSGGNGTSNTAVVSGTLAQLQALTSSAGSFSFVDSATQAATRDITISAVLNDQGNHGGTLANALTGSNSFKVTMAADPNRNATIDIVSINDGLSATTAATGKAVAAAPAAAAAAEHENIAQGGIAPVGPAARGATGTAGADSDAMGAGAQGNGTLG